MQLVMISSWYLVMVFSYAHFIFQGSFDHVVKGLSNAEGDFMIAYCGLNRDRQGKHPGFVFAVIHTVGLIVKSCLHSTSKASHLILHPPFMTCIGCKFSIRHISD